VKHFMPRFFAALMRHGQYQQAPDTPGAHQPHPLTQAGEAQARRGAGSFLEIAHQEGWRVDRVVDSSTILRAWQTATLATKVLATRLGTAFRVTTHDELAERSVGSAANLTMAQIQAVVAADPRCDDLPPNWKLTSRFRLPLPGAESLLEAGDRVARCLERRMDELARDSEEDTVRLFVGHGGAFRHAAVHLGVLELEQAPALSMHHCRPVVLERLDDGGWTRVAGRWKERNPKPTG
jgi:2,3-bisphosphoglycerate-dependent phosphoglycerate mutase